MVCLFKSNKDTVYGYGVSLYGKDMKLGAKYPPDNPGDYLLALPDGKILAATSEGLSPFLYQSTNKGKDWQLNIALPAGGKVSSLLLSKRGVIYCSADDGWLMRSTDMGASWNILPHQTGTLRKVLISEDDHIYLETYPPYTAYCRLDRSTDHGQTWLRIDTICIDTSFTRFSTSSYRVRLLLANKDKLYISYFYDDVKGTTGRNNVFLRCNPDGSHPQELIHDRYGDDDYQTPINMVMDSSGGFHAMGYRNNLMYSLDSGVTWKETAYMTNVDRHISIDTVQRFWDTLGIWGRLPEDHLTLMMDGHVHLSHNHYLSRYSVAMPPQRIASMSRCGIATATFVADSLAGVEWVQAKSMNVAVRFDTLTKGRSIQVHATRLDSSKLARFHFRATNTRGLSTEWAEQMYPTTGRQQLRLLPASKPKVPDSLDAGVAIVYIWYKDGKKLHYPSGEEFPRAERTMELKEAGTYWCEVFDSNGCVQVTAPYTFKPVGVADETHSNNSVQVYPNPAQDMLTLVHNEEEGVSIEIVDVVGRVVMQQQCSGASIQSINISSLANGVYSLRLSSHNNILYTRFVVNR